MRDRCTPEQREVEERLGHEVAVGHRIERVLEAAVEPELRGDVVGIERQRRAGQRAGAERRDVEAVDGGERGGRRRGPAPSRGPAGGGPAAPAAPAACGCSRAGRRRRPRRARWASASWSAMISSATPMSERRHHRRSAVATWSLRLRPVCSLAPTSPTSSVTRRSMAVWMSSSPGAKTKLARGELLLHHVERLHQGGHLAVGEDARLAQALDVRARAGQVVVGQHPVEGQADGERRHGVGHARRDATLPQRQCSPLTSPACPGADRLAARLRARPLAGRPRGDPEAPQADEPLGVGVAEGVRRIVGGQVVVVERDRAAPPHHGAGARRGEAQPHLAGHVALALGDEGLQRACAAASTTARRRRARTSAAPGAPSRGAGRARGSGPRGRRGP